ncbi:MAG: hypothetical protein ACYC63_08770 [Armatimonadota bacterium]
MHSAESEARQHRTPDQWRSVWPVTLLLIGMFLALIAAHPDRVNHDCAQHLQTGQMILKGAVPFLDVYDTNPPLIMYLSTIPAGIAQVLGAPIIPVFLLCVLALVLWSAGVTYRLLSSTRSVPRSQVCAIPLALMLVSLVLLATRDYGQREHLIILLLTPFLVFRSLRWLGWLERPGMTGLWLGLAAGAGVCLKPYFLLVIVLSELYWVLTRRQLRALLTSEILAAAAAVALYGLWLRWLMPLPAREVFWNSILPLVVQGYSAYNNPLSQLANPHHHVWPVAAVGVVGLLARPYFAGRQRQLVGPFAVAALASLGIFVAQSKLWAYHLVPAIVCAVIVLFLLYADLRERLGARSAELTPPATALAMGLPQFGELFALTALAATLGPLPGVRPSVFWLCLLLVGTCLDLRRQGAWGSGHSGLRRLRLMPAWAVVAAGLVVLGLWFGHANPRQPGPVEKVILRDSRPGDRVLVLSTSVADPPYPTLLQTGRFQSSRYLCAWPVPAFYQNVRATADGQFPYHRLETAPAMEQEFLRSLSEDLRRYRPPLVLIRSSGNFQACPKGFNLLEYFERCGFIAKEMSDYDRRESVGDYTVFTAAER